MEYLCLYSLTLLPSDRGAIWTYCHNTFHAILPLCTEPDLLNSETVVQWIDVYLKYLLGCRNLAVIKFTSAYWTWLARLRNYGNLNDAYLSIPSRVQKRAIEQERRSQKVLSEKKQCACCGKSFVEGEGATCPECKHLVCPQCRKITDGAPGFCCTTCSKTKYVGNKMVNVRHVYQKIKKNLKNLKKIKTE